MNQLSKALKCLQKLELETHELYHELYKKMAPSEDRGKILFISLDTYKHYLLYNELTKLEEESVNEEECELLLGQMFTDSLKFTRGLKSQIAKLKTIKKEDLENIVDRLKDHERGVYEEAMSAVAARFIGKENAEVSAVMQLIEFDEKRHEGLVIGLIKKENKAQGI